MNLPTPSNCQGPPGATAPNDTQVQAAEALPLGTSQAPTCPVDTFCHSTSATPPPLRSATAATFHTLGSA